MRAPKDLCICIVFLVLTTLIALSSKEIGMYYFKETMARLFLNRVVHNKHGHELTFEDLSTIEDWWSFVGSTLLESFALFDLNDSQREVILFGPPRLRQIRIRGETCLAEKSFQNTFGTCYGRYLESKEDIEGFLGLKHRTQSELSTYNIRGSLNSYRGGGYMKVLSYDKKTNENIVNKLKKDLWMDKGTRVMLIEFALYNQNINLFCNIKLLAESDASGGIYTSSRLQSLMYFPLWTGGDYYISICLVVFFGITLYYTYKAVQDLKSFGLIFCCRSIFIITHFIGLVIAYLSIGYITWHTIYIRSILNEFAKSKEQYLSLDIICFWNVYFIDTMGVFVLIAWIQIYNYINFNKTMLQFVETLRQCIKDILGFSIIFAFVFAAFTFLSVILFGSVDPDFITCPTAIITLMRTILGDIDYELMEAANPIMGPIFFLSFILFVFFILMNMFLAIICDTYTSVVNTEVIDREQNEIGQSFNLMAEKLIKSFSVTKNKQIQLNNEEKVDVEFSTHSSDTPEQMYVLEYFENLSSDNDVEKNTISERITLLEKKINFISNHIKKISNM